MPGVGGMLADIEPDGYRCPKVRAVSTIFVTPMRTVGDWRCTARGQTGCAGHSPPRHGIEAPALRAQH